jgi:large subunit ribosomal protein L6
MSAAKFSAACSEEGKMSRIGKHPVAVPQGATLAVIGGEIVAKGKLGELKMSYSDQVSAEMVEGELVVKPLNDDPKTIALWATTRANAANMVKGVTQGFSKTLELVGVGYRANVQGKKLVLQLGFSHDIDFPIPDGIKIVTPKPTEIEISGADVQKVGQIAAEIRSYRPPEPYKGKGVKYAGEQILRKEGKKK